MNGIKQSEFFNMLMAALGESNADSVSLTVGDDVPSGAQRGLRILLAEDNAINQELGLCLLQNWGHAVTVAGNGQAVLTELERHDFDLVLMDIQMPVVSGFEATAEIRDREKSSDKHIPIIAVTAYAMKGDRERCLAAGMDDYIAKPINKEEFAKAIERVGLMPVADRVSPRCAPPSTDIEGGRVLDHSKLLGTVNGNRELLRRLAILFLKRWPKLFGDLCSAIDDGDFASVARIAHNLRGGAGTFLSDYATSLLARLEVMGRDGNLVAANTILAELGREIALIQSELRTVVLPVE
jgi:two-component system sensor histidine kinase/response regulator